VRAPLAFACALTLALLAILVTGTARAQHGLSLRTELSSRQVAQGESFVVQLTALAEAGGAVPSSPQLKLPPGFVAHGPSVSTQQQVSIAGGQIRQRQGLTATWHVTAQRLGQTQIGPASVMVGGQRYEDRPTTIEIIPPGRTPPLQRPPARRLPFDPFDPFGGGSLFPSVPGFDDPADERDAIETLPAFPEEMRVERAPDSIAFLRATVSPVRAVVGEQVTLRVYAYGRHGLFREIASSEPNREDFLAFSVVENSYGEDRYRVPIAGEIWYAVKIRELALFPIKTGTLSVGVMTMGFEGRGYSGRGPRGALERKSSAVEVVVSEPPLAGRPPGYRLGDVGDYRLSAEVEPREVRTGEAVSVEIKLEGTGNLPYQLRTPEQRGIEWLEPTVVDDVEPRGSVVGGFRKFTYIVRLDKPGRVELGEVTLPYWHPARNAYAVARANLGSLGVAGSAKQEPAAAPSDSLQELLTPRTTLGALASAPLGLTNRLGYWLALALGPLSVLVAGASFALTRRLRARWSIRRDAPGRRAGNALEAARRAAASGDTAFSASAAERALIEAIDAAVGLKARAVLRSELSARLVRAGLSEELARQVADCLAKLDDLRFAGAADSASETRALVESSAELVRQLSRVRTGVRAVEARA